MIGEKKMSFKFDGFKSELDVVLFNASVVLVDFKYGFFESSWLWALVRFIVVLDQSINISDWSLFSKVVIVGVDSTTHLWSLQEALAADLVIAVVRNIELEEASVGLWEASFVQAGRQANLMLSRQICEINGKSVTTPDKFKVLGSFFMGEWLENSPESWDDLMISTAVWIDSNRLEAFHIDLLGSASSNLDCFRGKIGYEA